MRGASTSVRERPALAPAAVLLSGLVVSAYLYRTDPHEPGHLLPACPLRAVTGWLCPACGATRMTYDLMHGDVAHAWRDNALLLLVAPLGLWWLARWAVEGLRGRRYAPTLPTWFAPVVLTTALAWTVARNVA